MRKFEEEKCVSPEYLFAPYLRSRSHVYFILLVTLFNCKHSILTYFSSLFLPHLRIILWESKIFHILNSYQVFITVDIMKIRPTTAYRAIQPKAFIASCFYKSMVLFTLLSYLFAYLLWVCVRALECIFVCSMSDCPF